MSKQTKENGAVSEVQNPVPPTMNDSEGLPILKEKRKFKNLISGADFKEFGEGEIYEGTFLRETIREKDGPNVASNPNEKAGTVMGYLFRNDSGKEEIIGASHQITEVMKKASQGDYFRFTFLGKTENAKGQPVNRFRIDIAE